ncbi:MAG: hypothetical protein Q7S95_01835 [bacterium]|nr:hypothetical protein [bacterium]
MVSHLPLFPFVAGVVLGLVGAVAWFSGDLPALPALPFPGGASATPDDSGKDMITPQTGAVSVASQPSGMSVRIESVTVPPPGVWVAVREVVGHELGNVLGALRVGGPRTNMTVLLLRATIPGQRYGALLYRDDGNGTFDPGDDSVYIDLDTGLPAVVYFDTTE